MDIVNYLTPHSSNNTLSHPEMINIYGLLTITKASFYILVAGLVLSFILIFTIKLGIGHKLLAGLLLFLTFCVESYNVNCVQLGNCTTWAYLLTILYIGYAAIMAFTLLTNKSKANDVFAQYTKSKIF
jgi:hypothetical protein